MPVAPFIPLIIGAGASVGSSVIAAKGAKSAAETQAQSARDASDLFAPYRAVGTEAIQRLGDQFRSGGTLAQPFNEPFVAPGSPAMAGRPSTPLTLDPGYQFRLEEGQKALERSAAARGTLLTGGTAKALQRYGQGLASQEYGAAYNRAFGEYQQRHDIFRQNQSDLFNRETSLANLGYGATGQQADLNTSGAAAAAAGQVGSANAYAQGIGQLGGLFQDSYWLNRLFPQERTPKAPSTGSAYGGEEGN